MEYFAAPGRNEGLTDATTRTNLGKTPLSGRSQRPEYRLIPFILTVPSRLIRREKASEWLPGAGGGGNRVSLLKGGVGFLIGVMDMS